MKNIHVLPTDKPSRLLWCFEDKRHYTSIDEFYFKNQKELENENIYITNDEEIKQGDYYITPNNTVLKALGLMLINVEDYKKIILTTDQDLIKDGVQAIDDEFLEWFVKNPSCKSVEVENERIVLDDINYNFDVVDYKYKIIIPKEEPKQQTLEEAIENELDCIHQSLRNNDFDLGFRTGYVIDKPIHQQIIDVVGGEEAFKEAVGLTENKETLEEAKNNAWDNYEHTEGNLYSTSFKNGFELGAKWQQEQYTIEEQHVGHTIDELSKEYIKGFNEGSTWQQERSYSEEEVLNITKNAFNKGERYGWESKDSIANLEEMKRKISLVSLEELLEQFNK